MQGLILRLSELDPEAGAAVRVIEYFDVLTENGTGLQGVIRAVAMLTGSSVTLVDEERHLRFRIDKNGRVQEPDLDTDLAWPSINVDDTAVIWLERSEPTRVVDEVALERGAAAAKAVLQRTRSPGRRSLTEADREVLLDATALPRDRTLAARRLGFDLTARFRAIAVQSSPPVVQQSTSSLETTRTRSTLPDLGLKNAGVGPWGPILSLPESFDTARQALRFTRSNGSEPAPRIVYADDIGALTLLAPHIAPGDKPHNDVVTLERIRGLHHWMLETLYALVGSPSLRAAANELDIHHSTLQSRLVVATQELGWDPTTPGGRYRLHLALMLRQLHIRSS